MNKFASTALYCFALSAISIIPLYAQDQGAKEKDGLQMPAKEVEYKDDSAYPPRPRLLVTVNHNESFPPLPPNLRVGKTFDEKKVAPYDDSDNHWYQVPKWISGIYGYADMVSYESRDYETGEVSTKREELGGIPAGRLRGILVDKAGNIWQKIYGGHVLTSAPKGKSEDMELQKYDDGISGQILSPTQYAESSAGVEFLVNKKTHKIEFVSRWERIREFECKSDGVVNVDVSEKMFDSDGKPFSSYRMCGHMKKLQDFKPLSPGYKNIYAGSYPQAIADLRSYMEKTGHGSDAPAE
jgi:hypothetical protein